MEPMRTLAGSVIESSYSSAVHRGVGIAGVRSDSAMTRARQRLPEWLAALYAFAGIYGTLWWLARYQSHLTPFGSGIWLGRSDRVPPCHKDSWALGCQS